jgi:hypothetical protein
MIYIRNPLVLPVLLVIWSADLWLSLAALAFLADRLRPDNSFSAALRTIIRILPDLLGRWMQRWRSTQLPEPTLWLVAVVGVLMLRYILIYGILSIHSHCSQ